MLGGGNYEVSIMPVVDPRGTVSIVSLEYFHHFFYSSKLFRPSLPLSLSDHAIFKNISIIRGEGIENPLSYIKRRTGAMIKGSK